MKARGYLIALLAAALLLRVVPWLANLPLHHDEALYGTWARAIADGSDPLLLIPWIDKPPLVPYLLALSIKLFGTSELALRVPGMVASVLTVWVTFGLAHRTYGAPAAWVTGALVALSPFAILFGPTAFTDGWLTLFLIAAAWAALAGSPAWAGALLGMALASKQQGVLGAPLITGLLVAQGAWNAKKGNTNAGRTVLGQLAVALVSFAIVFAAVAYWDSLRWHNRPSYWDQSLQTYGGVVLASLADWPRRGVDWARQAGYLFGAPALTAAVMIAATGAAVRAEHQRRGAPGPRNPGQERRLRSSFRSGGERLGLLLGVYVLGYLVVHLAFTFQPWDRYLLPILPLICVLGGQGLVVAWSELRQHVSPASARLAAAPFALGLIYAASLGARGGIAVASDIGAYRGVAEAAHFLAEQPAGDTVFYDRIGWHLGYYLYGRPITRSWYDSPAKLASETARAAHAHPGAGQWLVLPAWEQTQYESIVAALTTKGFAARPSYEIEGRNGRADLTLYRLEPLTLADDTTSSGPAGAEEMP